MKKSYCVLFFLSLNIISCSSTYSLKIDEVGKCLEVDQSINMVSKCIDKFQEYKQSKSKSLGNIELYRINDVCNRDIYKNCSHKTLLKSLSIKQKDIRDPSTGSKKGEIQVISNPYVLFLSRAESLGGNKIMLYVFYDEDTKNVIGWVNLGSIINVYNFNKYDH
jgi:hypothetical protein